MVTIFNEWRKSVKLVKESKEIVNKAIETSQPFTYFHDNFDEFRKVTVEDYMQLFPHYESVYISSDEIFDIYEQRGYDYESIFQDVMRVIRNKQMRTGL